MPSTSGTMHGGGGLEQQQSGSTVAVQLPASGRESGEGGGGRAMRVQLQPLRMLPETMAAISHRAQHTARSVVDSSRRYFMRQRSRVVASTFVNADGASLHLLGTCTGASIRVSFGANFDHVSLLAVVMF